MAYYIIPRPAGTLPFKPGAADPLVSMSEGLAGGFTKGVEAALADDKAKKLGLEPEYTMDGSGQTSTTYKKPKGADFNKDNFLLALSGLIPLENGVPPDMLKTAGQSMDPYNKALIDVPGEETPTIQSPQVTPEQLRAVLRSSVENDPWKRQALGIPQEKETKTPTFEENLRSAIEGKMPWEELEAQYPTQSKLKDIRAAKSSNTPISKDPEFKDKKFFGMIDTLNDESKRVVDNLKNQADLDELIENKEDYEEAGVDVDAILSYFGHDRFGPKK